MDLLQIVANIEQSYLEINHELNVIAANLAESTLGSYKEQTHQISINVNDLSNSISKELLETLLHEVYHAYKSCLIEAPSALEASGKFSEDMLNLLIFRKTARYAEEFKNYTSGEDDADAYYSQLCETDAEDFAQDRYRDYYDAIFPS